jgi:serine phosphatase RsbU (regulator of sigma subunit)
MVDADLSAAGTYSTDAALASDPAWLLRGHAGHLPPYLNGEPVAMEGALPLGLMGGAEFSMTRFALRLDDRLVLVSDGLAEARNPEGQLFGFARVQQLVRDRLSVTEVVHVIQSFGQEDDISMIALTRTAEMAPA